MQSLLLFDLCPASQQHFSLALKLACWDGDVSANDSCLSIETCLFLILKQFVC